MPLELILPEFKDVSVPTAVMLVWLAVVIVPTKLAPVTAPDTDNELPVITPPTVDAAVTVPDVLIAPVVDTAFVVLLNVKPPVALDVPLSLKTTSVFAPGALVVP